MTIRLGQTYIFAKSGNKMRTITSAVSYRGQPMREVEQTQGESIGKQMDVPARALLTYLD